MNEEDLIVKYVVFKIKDVKECLGENEQKLFWSFLEKIIRIRDYEDSRENEFKKAGERLSIQFEHRLREKSDWDLDELLELAKEYDVI